MQIEIARPWTLLLLPLLAAIIIWFARDLHSRSRSRQIGEVMTRLLVLALLVFSMAGITVRRDSNLTTTVFLVDLSDSVRGETGNEAEFVQKAIAEMPAENQAGIVVFGSDSRIEQFVSDRKVFTEFQSEVKGTATNLEQAFQTALALFPDGSARRIVLLTDGEENEGNIGNLALSVAGSDLELKIVRYDSSIAEEVYVSNVKLPETIHQGDRFEVKVELYASESAEATVSLYSGRTLKGQKQVILQKGNNQLVFMDQGLEGGLKSYRVTVESAKDTVTVNNTYSAFTTVEAAPRILVVEGNAGDSTAFEKILQACNYDYEIVTPSGVPGQIADLTLYQTVIFLDVYADDLRDGFPDLLKTYVKDYAGGLVVLGGPNSYALGNYRNTPLEEVLPVKMELEGEKQIPKIAMTMVIDHSGSMSGPSTMKGSISKMTIAKHAAVNGLDSLREIDEVGVVAFDDTFDWAVPMQQVTDKDAIAEKIAGIEVRGGTSIYPALEAAMKQMEQSDAVLKHIVLLTDGQDGYHEYDSLLSEMNDKGITLSTVAVGEDADCDMMEWLAEKGNGRYYYSDAGSSLPRIFAQEVYLSAKSYLINEEFTPEIVNSHEIIRDIFTEGSPSLLGYIAATPKALSTVILESPREDPILTVWQYGLGRTAAWNSDGTGNWTGNFAGWDHYAELWRNLIDWTISNSELGSDTLQVEQQASSAKITYHTEEYSAATSISAVITDEDGNQQNVTLQATAPGTYEAEVPLEQIGVYSINVRNRKGSEIVKNINTVAAMQYSREYRYADVSNTLENFARQTGARYIDKPQEVFDSELTGAVTRTELTMLLMSLAAILFLLDIIIRRMHVDWMGFLSERVRKTAGKITGNRKHAENRKKTGNRSFAADSDAVDAEKKKEKEKEEKTENTESADNNREEAEPAEKNKKEVKPAAKTKRSRPSAAEKKKKDTGADVLDTQTLLRKKSERNQ